MVSTLPTVGVGASSFAKEARENQKSGAQAKSKSKVAAKQRVVKNSGWAASSVMSEARSSIGGASAADSVSGKDVGSVAGSATSSSKGEADVEKQLQMHLKNLDVSDLLSGKALGRENGMRRTSCSSTKTQCPECW